MVPVSAEVSRPRCRATATYIARRIAAVARTTTKPSVMSTIACPRDRARSRDRGPGRHPMAPTWPEFMKVTAVLEDAGEGCTTYHLSWQPHESDEAGHAAFDGAREGMQAGFAGTFAKLDAYLQGLQSQKQDT